MSQPWTQSHRDTINKIIFAVVSLGLVSVLAAIVHFSMRNDTPTWGLFSAEKKVFATPAPHPQDSDFKEWELWAETNLRAKYKLKAVDVDDPNNRNHLTYITDPAQSDWGDSQKCVGHFTVMENEVWIQEGSDCIKLMGKESVNS